MKVIARVYKGNVQPIMYLEILFPVGNLFFSLRYPWKLRQPWREMFQVQ